MKIATARGRYTGLPLRQAQALFPPAALRSYERRDRIRVRSSDDTFRYHVYWKYSAGSRGALAPDPASHAVKIRSIASLTSLIAGLYNALNSEDARTMKRVAISAIAFAAVFFTATLIINLPVRGHDNDRDRNDRDREDERELEVQQGLSIAPVPLNLNGKDIELVGLGSYIVNAQAGCNDCHTCPSYAPKHNPFPPPFGVSGDGQINSANYLAGGVDFGPPPQFGGVTSANITPDSTGKPGGLTLEQFENALRTGHDPLDPKNGLLAVMPWSAFRYMTGRISTLSTPI